jgi:hypothetical protein
MRSNEIDGRMATAVYLQLVGVVPPGVSRWYHSGCGIRSAARRKKAGSSTSLHGDRFARNDETQAFSLLLSCRLPSIPPRRGEMGHPWHYTVGFGVDARLTRGDGFCLARRLPSTAPNPRLDSMSRGRRSTDDENGFPPEWIGSLSDTTAVPHQAEM